ncbi:MAG: hypothetical protein R3F35_12705 [Myxococcota bacterium]
MSRVTLLVSDLACIALACIALAGFAAAPAFGQTRPSIGRIDAQQTRLEAALCAKADADGDAYRPFVCPARCDCFQTLGVPSSCQETSPGTYQIGFSTLPGTCTSNVCSNSTFAPCSAGAPCLVPGESCATSPFGFGSCRRTCSTGADCPPRPSGAAILDGVAPADSPAVVTCNANGVETPINSNDALLCLEQVEAVVACQ